MDSAALPSSNEQRSFGRAWIHRLLRWSGLNAEPVSPNHRYQLARFLILRLIGLVYFTGFLILIHQGLPLLGSRGLLPIHEFVARVSNQMGSAGAGFARLPSLFWFAHSDRLLLSLAWLGALLSLLVLLGATNAVVMTTLWALYMSFVHVGQDWYGYGWELQLLESGFLAIFLCPLRGWRPFPGQRPAPVVIWLFRWLIFRVMVGAGLIKLRGDPCWRDLTCLDYHYETQPNPNPVSRALHFAPHWVSAAGVVFNHVTELALPWLLLAGRNATRVAGVGFVLFQATLIASGNLSFLNLADARARARLLRRCVPRQGHAAAVRPLGGVRRTQVRNPQRLGRAGGASPARAGALVAPVRSRGHTGCAYVHDRLDVGTGGNESAVGQTNHEYLLRRARSREHLRRLRHRRA